MLRYFLITPAHNEELFIGNTIKSVAAQSLRPTRWIIVNDSSTDRTGEIIRNQAESHPFITNLEVQRNAGRNFGNKARAFNEGVAALENEGFDFIGNLDADITLEPRYFERLFEHFNRNPRLGLAGGLVHSRINGDFLRQKINEDSVAGAVQMFRRECFDQVGGYRLLPYGGIDAAAEISARMNGWQVRTLSDLRVLEHRRTGSATSTPVGARIKEGRRMHSLGYDPSFFTARCLYRLFERPAFIGSMAALFGYFSSKLKKEPVAIPFKTVQFLRSEQRNKLKRILSSLPRPESNG